MDNGHPTSLFNRSARESGWKLKLLALENLRDVKIEEVAVEDGLDTPGNDGDDVVKPLDVVSVDPVHDVEAAVGAESEEIVAGDGLGLVVLGLFLSGQCVPLETHTHKHKSVFGFNYYTLVLILLILNGELLSKTKSSS